MYEIDLELSEAKLLLSKGEFGYLRFVVPPDKEISQETATGLNTDDLQDVVWI